MEVIDGNDGALAAGATMQLFVRTPETSHVVGTNRPHKVLNRSTQEFGHLVHLTKRKRAGPREGTELVGFDRRPRNWWSFILCISNRNNTQEPDSETRDRRTREESDKQEQKKKSDSEGTIRERNNPRKNNFSTNPGNFSEHYIFLTQNR